MLRRPALHPPLRVKGNSLTKPRARKRRETDNSCLVIEFVPRVTAEQARWAAERIGQNGQLHENEAALINFLKSRQAYLHPKLNPILDRAVA